MFSWELLEATINITLSKNIGELNEEDFQRMLALLYGDSPLFRDLAAWFFSELLRFEVVIDRDHVTLLEKAYNAQSRTSRFGFDMSAMEEQINRYWNENLFSDTQSFYHWSDGNDAIYDAWKDEQ